MFTQLCATKKTLNAEKLGGKIQPANASQMQTECHLSLSYLRKEPASTHIANDVVQRSSSLNQMVVDLKTGIANSM